MQTNNQTFFVLLVYRSSEEGSQVTVELRRKRSKNALKVMSVFAMTSSNGNADPFQPDFSNDVLLAKFTISASYIERNCRNKLKKGVFVWQPVQSSTQITGIVSLQMYRHVDQTTWLPRDIAECAQLYKQRTFERTSKVWGEGFIHIGQSFLVRFLLLLRVVLGNKKKKVDSISVYSIGLVAMADSREEGSLPLSKRYCFLCVWSSSPGSCCVSFIFVLLFFFCF